LERLEDRTLLNAGMLDPTFGTGGEVVASFQGSMDNIGQAAALQSDGKIVTVGQAISFNTANGNFALTRTNPDGSLDLSFGNGGRVITQFATQSQATAVAIAPDHKIVVAGIAGLPSNSEFAVARYNADGTLDTTFGNGGTVTTLIMQMDSDSGVAVQADGKIIVAGSAHLQVPFPTWESGFVLLRYNPDGSLDSTFASAGFFFPTGSVSTARAVTVQADGRILAVGYAVNLDGSPVGVVVKRFNSDGSLDSSFGTGGQEVISTMNLAQANAVALQADGKIVLAGDATSSGGSTFAVVRLNTDGSLDTTFNQTGIVVTGLNQQDVANGVAIQGDGRIVASGMTTPTNGLSEFALVRYNTDGSLDAGFGQGGKVFTIFGAANGSSALSVFLQSDQKIIAGGYAIFNSSTGTDFALARYNTDGSADTGFGSGGQVTIDFPGAQPVTINAVTIQADGKIIAAGNVAVADPSSIGFVAVARFNSDGSLDTTFGKAGWATFDVAGFGGSAAAVAFQPDGKIVVAGKASVNSNRASFELMVGRLNADGSLDKTFGNQGLVTSSFSSQNGVTGVVIQPDGKIVALGTMIVSFPTTDVVAVRYNTDGSPDSSFGANGLVTITSEAGSAGVVLQPDGKIVLSSSTNFDLVRLNPNGTLDTGFGTGGTASLSFGATVTAAALALQIDGKLVVAGTVNPGVASSDFALARFNSDGSVDTGFGNGGRVTTDFTSGIDAATSVVIEGNGKILAGGSSQHGSSTVFALARYNANGTLDAGFGTGGEVTTDIGTGGAVINGLALQADGSLVAAGSQPSTNGLPFTIPATANLARYLLPPSQNERFIDQLYPDLLNRPMDPSGLSIFLNALDEGLVTRMQVAQIIEASQEYRTDLVQGMYMSFLGRSADAGGLQFWVSSLNAGATIEQIKSGILGSGEYFQRNGGTNSSFLQGVYHDVLSRPIDPSGAAAWGAELASGTSREVVAAQILASGEAESDLITSVYEHFLRRAPEPAGLSFWLNQLQQGLRDEDFIAAVAGSGEYYSRV
jgi:uncharacterized delta-60 repeat protein